MGEGGSINSINILFEPKGVCMCPAVTIEDEVSRVPGNIYVSAEAELQYIHFFAETEEALRLLTSSVNGTEKHVRIDPDESGQPCDIYYHKLDFVEVNEAQDKRPIHVHAD